MLRITGFPKEEYVVFLLHPNPKYLRYRSPLHPQESGKQSGMPLLIFHRFKQVKKIRQIRFTLQDPIVRLQSRSLHIPKDGGSRFSLPPELELKCHKNKKGYPDVYGRMKWDDVAPTLTTGCTDITRGRFAHPRDDRAITLREAALLQTFPVNYKFAGNSSQIAAQIGNAVPVKMVEAIAINLHKFIEGAG